jgi:hypothetical protein
MVGDAILEEDDHTITGKLKSHVDHQRWEFKFLVCHHHPLEMASPTITNAPVYGTVSQANTQGQLVGPNGSNAVVGESVPGSQRVVANASHWWLQHGEDEPLPGCSVPV